MRMRRRYSGVTQGDLHRTTQMTDAQRAAALAELAIQLAELMTESDRNTFPVLPHLYDLVEDLEG